MEHLDNDMDELFRKAGDGYPLKKSEPDWESVSGKLNSEKSPEADFIPRNSGNRRRRFLLLLIPLGLTAIFILNSGVRHDESRSDSAMSKKSVVDAKENQAAPKEKVETTTPRNSSAVGSAGSSSIDNNQEPNRNSAEKKKYPVSSVPLNSTSSTISRTNHTIVGSKDGITGVNEQMINNGVPSNENDDFSGTAHRLGSVHDPAYLFTPFAFEPVTAEPVSGSPFSIKPANESSLKISDQAPAASQSSKNKIAKKGIYVGLVAGPDLSMVKFQSAEQPGFSVGAIVGYRLNAHWAIESGLYWDKKYYYSSGKYFDKSKTKIPYNVNVLWLYGNCNMFEIPLNVRYDFAKQRNHNFYVKGGFSSYIMKKENYTYEAEYSGAQWPEDASYKNSTNNFISIVQLSAGYQYSIGAKTTISIEPYVKIPIQGIGIGDMPISSAGLYFGISHSFR